LRNVRQYTKRTRTLQLTVVMMQAVNRPNPSVNRANVTQFTGLSIDARSQLITSSDGQKIVGIQETGTGYLKAYLSTFLENLKPKPPP
jgi:hypothetical protein